jgi:peptidoglycan/LPS O-acetylase OafA/YrhL
MPLFFSLSGYLFFYEINKYSVIEIIKKKAIRLLVPYFTIALLWMIPIKLIAKYPAYNNRNYFEIFVYDILLANDNGHLWFLPCLFLCFVICKLFSLVEIHQNIEDKYKDLTTLFVALIASIVSSKISFFGSTIQNTLQYYFYFYLGVLFCKYSSNFFAITSKYIFIAVVVSIILSVLSLINKSSFDFITSSMLDYLMFLLIPRKKIKVLSTISRYSFGIYLFHSPLIYITFAYFLNSNPFKVVFINFFIFGTLSLLMSIIVSKSPFKIVLGEHSQCVKL